MLHRTWLPAVVLSALTLLAACSPTDAIALHFGDDPTLHRQALAVAECESELDTSAISRTSDYGLFQINSPTWKSTWQQVTGAPWEESWHNPYLNAWFARWLYNESGGSWRHWTCQP